MDHFRTLIDADTIERRIRELSIAIAAAYRDEPPCVISVIEGARTFTRHLSRYLGWPTLVHEIRASSYGSGMASNGEVQVTGPHVAVRGRSVLLIEDIVDTGHTIARLREIFTAQGAARIEVVTLLTKPARREVEVALDYVGFEIPNEFVIGFGMDVAGRYRELDRVAVYDPNPDPNDDPGNALASDLASDATREVRA